MSKKSPVNKLTDEQKSEIRKVVQRIAEETYSDTVASQECCGDKLTNVGFIDGICDMLSWYAEAGGYPLSPDTKKWWDETPHAVKVRWLNLECRYV